MADKKDSATQVEVLPVCPAPSAQAPDNPAQTVAPAAADPASTSGAAAPVNAPGATLLAPAENVGVPAPQVVYLKTPLHKLVWFWTTVGLAAACLCLIAGAGGVLIGQRSGARQNRSAAAPMRMYGPGEGGGAYYTSPYGQGSRDPQSLEATGTAVPNWGQRLQKNGRGSGKSDDGGQSYVTPGPGGQRMVTPQREN